VAARGEALPPIASARGDVVSGLRGRATPWGERHRPAQGKRAVCDRHPGGVRRRWYGSHAPGPGARQPLRGVRDGRAGAARCDRRALRARYRRTRYTRAPSSALCRQHRSHPHEHPIPLPPRLHRALSSSSTRPSGAACKEQVHRVAWPLPLIERSAHPGCPATH
jgi:hypothetical protein